MKDEASSMLSLASTVPHDEPHLEPPRFQTNCDGWLSGLPCENGAWHGLTCDGDVVTGESQPRT